MQVGNIMSPVSAVVGPEHTLRQAAARMVQHNTGAAIVMDPALPGPHVITERDLLHAVADGLDVDTQRVGDHMNNAVITAAPTWAISRAAELMVAHAVRHVLVFDGTPGGRPVHARRPPDRRCRPGGRGGGPGLGSSSGGGGGGGSSEPPESSGALRICHHTWAKNPAATTSA